MPGSFSYKALTNFPNVFWQLLIVSFLEKVCVASFVANAAEIYQTRFNLTLEDTGFIIGIPSMVTAIFAPILALFLDRFGRRCYLWIIGFCLIMAAHIIFFALNGNSVNWAVLTMFLLGLGSTIMIITVYTVFSYVVT